MNMLNLVFLIAQGALFGYVVSLTGISVGDPTGLLLLVVNSALVALYGITQDQ